MIHFPNLSTGAVCQYPLARTRAFRTVLNLQPDGSAVKLSDPTPQQMRWDMAFQGLTRSEWAVIEEFFSDREGRLSTFLFLDPADNLLCFSDEFGAGTWIKGPGLTLTNVVPGPIAGSTATRVSNGFPVVQSLEQIANLPADGTYCYSVYVRAPEDADVALVWRAGTVEDRRHFRAGSQWGRISFADSPGATEEQVSFGVEISSGAAIEIFGAQVECQMSPSPYKRTREHCGVYPQARFDTDSLVVSIHGVDEYSVNLRVAANR
jgi:hypothetical protein